MSDHPNEGVQPTWELHVRTRAPGDGWTDWDQLTDDMPLSCSGPTMPAGTQLLGQMLMLAVENLLVPGCHEVVVHYRWAGSITDNQYRVRRRAGGSTMRYGPALGSGQGDG